jgi:hypothetical protein
VVRTVRSESKEVLDMIYQAVRDISGVEKQAVTYMHPVAQGKFRCIQRHVDFVITLHEMWSHKVESLVPFYMRVADLGHSSWF